MRNLPGALLALSLLSASAFQAGAQITSEPIQQTASNTAAAPELTAADLNDWLDGFMPYALSSADVVGAVVTIVHNGQIIAKRGYGYADLENRTPIDPDTTLFRPGSVSKLFTWTAAMQLVEQGKLDLDADVNTYLDFRIPEYRGAPITMRHLMTHTSGFEEAVYTLVVHDQEVVLRDYLVNTMPARIYPPGAMPAYSNYATALAGYIVERVSGEPFEDYVQRHVFDPLGMTHSTFRQPLPEAMQSSMSLGYRNLRDGRPQDFEVLSPNPAGGMSSSGSDMARFMMAHLAGGAGLMRPETARLMHTTVDQQFPGVSSMLLGFYQTEISGQRVIAHSGDLQWFHSDLSLLPEQNVGVYISMNSAGGAGGRRLRGEFISEFVKRYFPEPAAAVTALTAAPTAREHGALVAGEYESARRAETNPLYATTFLGQSTVTMLPNGDLNIPGGGEGRRRWREVAPWVWQAVGSEERMGARVENGQVVAIAVEPLSFAIPRTRVPWWRSKTLLQPLLFGALAVFAATLLSWPARALVRRTNGVPFPYEGPRALAHRLTPLLSGLALAYILAWGWFVTWILGANFQNAGAASYLPLLALYVAGVVPIAVLGGLAYANWSLWRAPAHGFARAWGGVLLLSAVIVLWLAVVLRFYSFDFRF